MSGRKKSLLPALGTESRAMLGKGDRYGETSKRMPNMIKRREAVSRSPSKTIKRNF